MLTTANKESIYSSLSNHFEKGCDFPLSALGKALKVSGINFKEFGYKSVKALALDLEFLSLKTLEKDGHKREVFTLKPLEKRKESKLTEEDKELIERALEEGIGTGNKVVLAYAVQVLINHGVDLKKYDKKAKILLKDCPFLSLSEEDDIAYVTLKDRREKEFDKILAPTKMRKEEFPKVELKELYLSENIALSIREHCSLGLDTTSLADLLLKEYERAKKEKTVRKTKDGYLFPVSLAGKSMQASIQKSTSKTEYKYFISYYGFNKEKAGDSLKNDIYFKDFDAAVKSLAELALKEQWCYRNSTDKHIILKIYLQYTYARIKTQDKIIADEQQNFYLFNTGLKDSDYQDIYCLLVKNADKNIKEPYLFQGFSTAGGQGLGKIIVERFNPLAKKATYLKSKDEMFYDVNSELHVDEKHIILDNLDRFPTHFLANIIQPFKTANSLYLKINSTKNELQKRKLWGQLEECIASDSLAYNFLKTTLNLSINRALRMVNYDYRTALPSFFPTRETISLMLPLVFEENRGPEAVLLVEKTPSGNYQGQTILTLKQCYVNARMISTLENTFLDPKSIED